MTTKQKLIRLKSLSKEAGANIFERCKLAAEVLQDTDWIAEIGDELKARDLLEEEYFRDVRGYISVGRLVEIYRAYPVETKWQEVKYDLAVMDAIYEEQCVQRDSALKGSRTSWKAVAEKLQEEVEQLRSDRTRDRQESQAAIKESRDLREKIRDLERENAMLQGRISELERMLKLDAAAA